MAVTTHMCRGNFRSSWVAEGGYDFVAEALFGQLDVDGFFMEWDDARSGGFEPLRFVPKGKQVVLGLVTTKRGELESKDDLKRRIEEASQYVDVDQLCLSPQCGFSSTVEGNALSREQQAAKLRLIVETARRCGADAQGLAGIVAAALLALAGCGDDGGSSGAKEEGGVTKVKVGVLPISNVAPLYLGMKKGFFKEEGLEVEPSIGQSGNELVTGDGLRLDASSRFLGYVPLMSARSQGLPVKVVANADNGAETAKDKEWTLLALQEGQPDQEARRTSPARRSPSTRSRASARSRSRRRSRSAASTRTRSSCSRSRSRRCRPRWTRGASTRSGRPSRS